MAGVPATRADVDTWAAAISHDTIQQTLRIRNFYAWLNAKSDGELQAEPYSYTAGEVAVLRSAFSTADGLMKLAELADGNETLGTPTNLLTFAKQLTGIVFG